MLLAALVFLLGVWAGAATAQEQPVPLSDYLIAEYGDGVEWAVADGKITLWRMTESRTRAVPILKPTEAKIAAWRADAALTARLRAAESSAAYPVERALIFALCASMACDAATVWAAFQAAVEP